GVIAAPGEGLRLGRGRLHRPTATSSLDASVLRVQLEQPPDARNQVFLSTARDTAGQPRPELRLSWTEQEEHAHARSLRIAADALGLDGQRLATTMQAMLRSRQVGYFWHHMGTTRMAVDPREGVVDADCGVHGVSNLFIAGSSVFPTGGTAAPTLTIVALAVRLATHLRQRHA